MSEYIFGPVSSRRFGRSLGVSVVPDKICNFDCVYCEIGKTKKYSTTRACYAKASAVLADFDRLYPKLSQDTDVVTITGAGEPTLNTDLKIIIEEIKKRLFHPLVILTNSTTINDKDVREALSLCDIVVPSLDAVSQDIFEKVDKPAEGILTNDIIQGLIEFSHTYNGRFLVELLLVKGVNDSESELTKIADAVKKMKYEKVILGTVFRPPAYEGFDRLSDEELEKAYLFLKSQGVVVDKAGVFIGKIITEKSMKYNEELLLKLLKMRPGTIEDIASGLSMAVNDAKVMVDHLMKNNKVTVIVHNGNLFYAKKQRAIFTAPLTNDEK